MRALIGGFVARVDRAGRIVGTRNWLAGATTDRGDALLRAVAIRAVVAGRVVRHEMAPMELGIATVCRARNMIVT
jgi:hypothetical protein